MKQPYVKEHYGIPEFLSHPVLLIFYQVTKPCFCRAFAASSTPTWVVLWSWCLRISMATINLIMCDFPNIDCSQLDGSLWCHAFLIFILNILNTQNWTMWNTLIQQLIREIYICVSWSPTWVKPVASCLTANFCSPICTSLLVQSIWRCHSRQT